MKITEKTRILDLEEIPAKASEPQVSERFAGLDLDPSPVPFTATLAEKETSGPVQEAFINQGLDFNVYLQTIDTPIPLANADDYRVCSRDYKGQSYGFGIVSKKYGFIQPMELAALFDEAWKQFGGDSEVIVNSSTFGKKMWINIPLTDFEITSEIREAANSSSPIKMLLRGSHAYGGSGAFEFRMGAEVEVCSNGLTVPIKGYSQAMKWKHTKNHETNIRNLMRVLEQGAEVSRKLISELSMLANRPMTQEQFSSFAETMFPLGKKAGKKAVTGVTNKRDRLAEIYQSAPGASPGTLWGGLQSATYYATHEWPVKVGGQSISRYSLDIDNPTESDLSRFQAQARLESISGGSAGEFTAKAFQATLALI